VIFNEISPAQYQNPVILLLLPKKQTPIAYDLQKKKIAHLWAIFL
jgi:hypothetical protein